jgi:hypothetical protein
MPRENAATRPESSPPLFQPKRKPRAPKPPPPPPEDVVSVDRWFRNPRAILPNPRARRFVRAALARGKTGGTLRDAADDAGCSSLAYMLGSDRVVRVLELLAPLELEPAAAVALLEPLRVARLFETARHGTSGAQRIAAERELADRYGRPGRSVPGVAARGQRAPAPGGFAAARAADRARRETRAAGASPAGAIGEAAGPGEQPSPAGAAGAPDPSPEVAG